MIINIKENIMKNKICVYTCITGNYDKIKELDFKEEGIDYYFFTNNKNLTSKTWKVIYIENDGLDNIRLARKIKVLGHEILKKYDVTVWLDGASYIRKSICQFLQKYCNLERYALIGFRHNFRDCIYEEALECIKVKKDSEETVKKQMDKYCHLKYPKHYGLIESTILIRNFNDEQLNKVMNDWFLEICNYSYRDQLSFNYVAWENNFKFDLLDMNVFDNEYFGWEKHQKNNNKKLDDFYVYFGRNEDFSYGSLLKGNYKKKENHYVGEFNILKNCFEFKIEFAQFTGILFSNLKLQVKNMEKENLVNYSQYFEYQIFDNEIPTIFVYGNFKKNQKVRFEIEMLILDDEFYLSLLKRFNESLMEVMNHNCQKKDIGFINKVKFKLGRKEK